MGCIFSKEENLNEMVLSPLDQKVNLLRYVMQNSRQVKKMDPPDMTPDERMSLQVSSRRYFNNVDCSETEWCSPFKEFEAKNPNTRQIYFQSRPPSLTDVTNQDLNINKADPVRHLKMSLQLLKNLIHHVLEGMDPMELEGSLQRIGAMHAEVWVCSKDIMALEDSFMSSIDQSNPRMDNRTRQLWRKIIRFLLYNIITGINNHYAKLHFIFGHHCWRFLFGIEGSPPVGLPLASYDSLKKMAAYIQAQAEE